MKNVGLTWQESMLHVSSVDDISRSQTWEWEFSEFSRPSVEFATFQTYIQTKTKEICHCLNATFMSHFGQSLTILTFAFCNNSNNISLLFSSRIFRFSAPCLGIIEQNSSTNIIESQKSHFYRRCTVL